MTRRPLRRRALASIGVTAALALVSAGGAFLLLADEDEEPAGSPVGRIATTEVVRTDLRTELSADGELGYGPEFPVSTGSEGRVTWLPRVGRQVVRGEPLLRVDDQPVTLFYGSTPLYRPLDATGLVGRDVMTVATNLRELGYDIGYQPGIGTQVRQPAVDGPGPSSVPEASTAAEGSEDPEMPAGRASGVPPAEVTYATVGAGDAVLTAELRAAVERWQEASDALPTGSLELGSVVVEPGAVRVSSVDARLGDSAATPAVGVTGTSKVITASLKSDLLGSVRGARSVVVDLPDGSTVGARIGRISRVAATPDGQDPDPTTTVTLVPKRPAVLRRLDSAPVTIRFATQARTQVLAVPVEALLALAGGGYGLQTSDGTLLAVQVGLIATGLAEVAGDGVTEGLDVVTAS